MEEDLFKENVVDYIEERNFLLKEVPYATVRRAWFTMSHMLLDEGARIVDMGCNTGELTYAMAVLFPKLRFIGVDKSKRNITQAKEKYKVHNLEFRLGDISSDLFEPESIDAIINSFILHQVFSDSRYNERIISDTLRKQFSMLKQSGMMFIRDFAKPTQVDELILMEMHDIESESEELSKMSEPDLLVWYSEHARPKQNPGCGGFFLEELAPRFPKTRLFRLPYKWAYEFIMRKDSREKWENNLPFEYTYFTVPEFRNELRSLGARVEYSAPHWDDDFIRKHFMGRFRLLQLNGDQLGDPPTSFIAVARKMPERTSLSILERRISHEEGKLKVRAVRDEKSGEVIDIVSRGIETAEIIPYRITDQGRLNIYLHEGIARGIVNTVNRSGINIDGREWSGHMIEPATVNYSHIKDMDTFTPENSAAFAKNFLGLTAAKDAVITAGASYFPDPSYIDEKVNTYCIKVEEAGIHLPVTDKILQHSTHFQAKGIIKEFSAQQVLDAVAVGLIPNARLELQILGLMQLLKIKAENWISKEIAIGQGEITQKFQVREFLRQVGARDDRFKEIKGTAGQLRAVNSVFVEECHSQGGYTGLSSENVDFVISDEKTINTAVILPITGSVRGDLHAGFLIKHMPVPQRHLGNGLTVTAPQINIPKEITNYRMLKQFIAEKFGVTTDMVLKLGESYFSHIGMTPQRIHPFAIAAPPAFFRDPRTRFMPMYQYMILWRSISREPHFMTVVARAFRFLPQQIRMDAKREVLLMIEQKFKAAQPDWSIPATTEGAEKPQNKMTLDDVLKLQHQRELTNNPHENNPRDFHKKKELEKEKRRERKRQGLTGVKGIGLTEDEIDDVEEEFDQESYKKLTSINLDLVQEFEKEIEDIKKAIEEEQNKPKPEKW